MVNNFIIIVVHLENSRGFCVESFFNSSTRRQVQKSFFSNISHTQEITCNSPRIQVNIKFVYNLISLLIINTYSNNHVYYVTYMQQVVHAPVRFASRWSYHYKIIF